MAPQGTHWLAWHTLPPVQSAEVQQLPDTQAPPQQNSPAAHGFWTLHATHWFAVQASPFGQSARVQQSPLAHAPPQQT